MVRVLFVLASTLKLFLVPDGEAVHCFYFARVGGRYRKTSARIP